MSKDLQQQQLLEFAVKIAVESGSLARKYFRTPVQVDSKSKVRFDPVTRADREVEQFLRNKISRKYPQHGINGEEQGQTEGNGWTWIIDPIDGTRGFIAGTPMWGTLLGLIKNGKPVLGLMHQPFVRETFFADQKSAWHKQGNRVRQLQTRSTRKLADAILCCTHPDLFKTVRDKAAFARLETECRYSRFGTDCYAYSLLAAGYIDLVVECDLQAYDIIPLIPLIESAGGVITDWEGNSPLQGGKVLAAANRSLHGTALRLLQSKK